MKLRSPSFFLIYKAASKLPFFSTSTPFWAAAAKGSMTYAFTHREFSLSSPSSSSPPPTQILALKQKSQYSGPNPSLEARVPVSRPNSQPLSPKFQPLGPKSSNKVKIPAPHLIFVLKPKSQPQGINSSPKAHIEIARRRRKKFPIRVKA